LSKKDWNFPTLRKALLFEKLENDKAKCILCERKCLLSPSETGFCGTRINIGGYLYTLVYGDISAIESRPIEIKPFFHYWPGSSALTFSTWSCNLNCVWCQNFHLSKQRPNPSTASYFSQQQILEIALNNGDEGLCASFQEPTLLSEWVAELFKMGVAKGLYCCYVSNGYMSLETLKFLHEAGLSGLKIDIKGEEKVYKKYCGGADVEKIWRNAREAKKMGIHVEIVNLVVNGVNDSVECLEWVIKRHLKEVGCDTPLHFTRYYPAYKFDATPTPIHVLEKAYSMAKTEGVLYPYIGNVIGHPYENTYCPNCGEKLVQRYGPTIVKYRITNNNKCSICNHTIPIVGKYIAKKRSFFAA